MRRLAGIAAAAALSAAVASFATGAQTLAWNRALSGPSAAPAFLGDGHVVTRALAVDAAGNVVVGGASDNGTHLDLLVAKLATDGSIAWQKTVPGAGGDEEALAVALDASGNAIVAGIAPNARGDSDILVLKYSAGGALLWSRTFDGGDYDAAYVVAVDAHADVLVGGESANASHNVDIHVLKLAGGSGAALWERTFDGGAGDYVTDLALDAAGNAIVSGVSVNASGNDDFTILKLNAATGAIAWRRTFDGGGDDEPYGVALDAAGNAFVTGVTKRANADFETLKLSAADGSIAWQKTYDGGSDDYAQAVAMDASGNAVVTGRSRNAAGNFDSRTIKYGAADGAVIWQQAFDGGADDYPYGVDIDPAGNAIVAGSSYAGGNADWKTIAYAAADGTVLYQRSYAGAANAKDEAYAVASRASGTFVAGTVVESGSTTTLRVEKLAPLATSASGPAVLASPAPGGTLASSTVTFQWNDAGASLYQVWVGNSVGADDIGYYPASGTRQTSTPITGLPTDGRKLYVRLYSNIGGAYQYRDYQYTAATGTGTGTGGAGATTGAAAVITSPANGSTLTGSSATFQWNDAGASLYQLWVGNSLGAYDIGYYPASGTRQTSTTATGLPTDGRKLYVRLFSNIGGTYVTSDFTYTAAGAGSVPAVPTPAALTSPAPGATLGASSQTFQWNNSGASLYQLWIGTSPGGFEIGYYPASGTAQTSIAVTGLPADGRKLYARLYSAINGAWQYRDFTYSAAGAGSAPPGAGPASITSPANGSTLHGATQLFQWNDAGAQLYQLWVGSAVGADDLGYFPAAGTTSTSATATALPTDGRTLYVRLYSAVGGAWQFRDFTFRSGR